MEIGKGNSNQKFLNIILKKKFWKTNPQKQFIDYKK